MLHICCGQTIRLIMTTGNQLSGLIGRGRAVQFSLVDSCTASQRLARLRYCPLARAQSDACAVMEARSSLALIDCSSFSDCNRTHEAPLALIATHPDTESLQLGPI